MNKDCFDFICLSCYRLVYLFIHQMSRVYIINVYEIKVHSVRVGIDPSLFKFKQQDIPVIIHLTSGAAFTW